MRIRFRGEAQSEKAARPADRPAMNLRATELRRVNPADGDRQGVEAGLIQRRFVARTTCPEPVEGFMSGQGSGAHNNRTGFIQCRFVGLSTGSSVKIIFFAFLLAISTLSCAVGMLAASDPAFTPPSAFEETPTATLPTAAEPTATPEPTATATLQPPTPVSEATPTAIRAVSTLRMYTVQGGDTLPVVAIRFGVQPGDITSPNPLAEASLLDPGQLLLIPDVLANTTNTERLIPDSEMVFSPSAMDFDVAAFVNEAGGYLSTYQEYLGSTHMTSGAEIVKRVALENSVNPRLLLAILEYQSGWVYGQPLDLAHSEYPLGKIEMARKGLYQQLAWAVNQLSVGYYGWREGWLTEITFSDGVTTRLAPELNAGTVALQYYYAQVFDIPGWMQALDLVNGLPGLHERMFGNAWLRAQEVEPLYPPGIAQPRLILPFQLDWIWAYTGGPHGAWEHDGARAALDFAPGSMESGCVASAAWVVSASAGVVTRWGEGYIVVDVDGDGYEQTGWAILYLHLSDHQINMGDTVEAGDILGHPSCEGGVATGTHLHIARKYNGEWVAADGPLPFVLSGWTAHAGGVPYEGTLTRDNMTIPSNIYGAFSSRITRGRADP